ncbi:MAG TPA: hypothetical protein DDW19_09460 [Anaerolineaceae bacterium]|jgi:putative sterol carrier protein|nr:hypothetical protein [Anaerolineaceae bacterium]
METTRMETLMKELENSFLPEKSEGMKGEFQCHITGIENGEWLMRVGDAKCRITPGSVEMPLASLSLSSEDLDALLTGKLDPMKALLTGRIELKGDVGVVLKFLPMFRLDPARFKI